MLIPAVPGVDLELGLLQLVDLLQRLLERVAVGYRIVGSACLRRDPLQLSLVERLSIAACVAWTALAASAAQPPSARTHAVTFRRLNGTVLMQTNVVHGADASSLAPALPAEGGLAARRWDCAEKLASVTNDVTCWALYEAVPGSEKAPSTSIASKSVVDRTTPCSLDEYFRLYDNLAWSDEFSGSTLSVGSGANWGYETDERNRELQRYTTTDSNHIVSDGTLKLQARRESKDGRSFTSGAVRSEGRVAFKFGRCEIRAKLTKQKGTWPAFWLMGSSSFWPHCGNWPGQLDPSNSSIANFQSEDFEIDYCRVFTNTKVGNTIERPAEPDGARLSGPVKATVWRGWQMTTGKSGAGYFGSHLAGEVVFGILATQDLSDWTAASLIPMKKFSADSLWKPIASESSTYVFPARMFFKYTIDLPLAKVNVGLKR